MTTKTKQFIVSVKTPAKAKQKATFYELAVKDIIKSENRKNLHLSEQIDQILYGA